MVTDILHDLLDFRYATMYNLHSRTCKWFEGSLLQPRKDFKRLIAAGYILPVDQGIPVRETSMKQFYKITKDGAEYVDRRHGYKPVERKESSSLKHESVKIDVLKSFKLMYGARQFDYHVSIDGHRPDAVIHVPFKCYLEVEIKDRPDKVMITCRKWSQDHKDGPVLVVYSDFSHDPFVRFQRYADKTYENARIAMSGLLRHAKKAGLSGRFLFTHHVYYHKLDDKVWFTPDGSRYSLDTYGKERGLIK
jgi:hypothetical protein